MKKPIIKPVKAWAVQNHQGIFVVLRTRSLATEVKMGRDIAIRAGGLEVIPVLITPIIKK